MARRSGVVTVAICIFYLVFCSLQAVANPPNGVAGIMNMNTGWLFTIDSIKAVSPAASSTKGWKKVSLPHTWNVEDVMDDEPGYYRGVAWYKKTITLNSSHRNKQLFLYFEGVNQEAEVYVNGKKAGAHKGGYTGFCVPITNLISTTNNSLSAEILVKVDNSFNENIPPLTADFTFFGGIYRSVSLIVKNPVHFSVDDHGSSGIYITTPAVSKASATTHIKGILTNDQTLQKQLRLVSTVVNAAGKKVAQAISTISVAGRGTKLFEQDIKPIANPHLWTPEDPYLYSVSSKVYDAKTGALLDEVTNPLGFRWFRFDAEQGFFLNDKHYKLIGASRHQDYEGMGNAVPKALQAKDVQLLKDMGGNFLRVAHYPQDPIVLKECDRLGILASVEIPIVNAITETDEFYNNCKEMQLEMIRQNYNHPSVIIWAYMNEVLLRPKFINDKPRQKIYFSNITKLAQELEDLTRKEDAYRYTMMSNHGDFNGYKANGLTEIPMIVGWNLYQGWYGSSIEGFASFLDRHHKEIGHKPVIITEYGADADPRIRADRPVRFDKSVEYASFYHKVYLDAINKRPFVAGAAAWNLSDFNSETREESMPHINNKGLLTWDRKPKDTYHYYQAMFLKKPFIKIASSSWQVRAGIAESVNRLTYTQPVEVYTNLANVELVVNGKSLGAAATDSNVCKWNVSFKNGTNKIVAISKVNGITYKDEATIQYQIQPKELKSNNVPFKKMNLLLGSNRYFIQRDSIIWMPSQEYKSGQWGSIGGSTFKMKNTSRTSYGTEKNIKNTFDDPIYQTQVTGINEYKVDVPAGTYKLQLHFAELMGGEAKEALAYNLDTTVTKEVSVERVFDVFINNKLFLKDFNVEKEYGVATMVVRSVDVKVIGEEGLRIVFTAKKGEAVLNALQVERID